MVNSDELICTTEYLTL